MMRKGIKIKTKEKRLIHLYFLIPNQRSERRVLALNEFIVPPVVSAASPAKKDNLDRFEKDHKIQKDGKILDVVKVILEFLDGIL